jgi:hypothetical protein
MPLSYNYPHFTMGDEDRAAFAAFQNIARVGSPAPDAELVDAVDERRIRLSALWRERPLVIEFGSLT